jgi:hypothetical protein
LGLIIKWFFCGQPLTEWQLSTAHSRGRADALAVFDGAKKLSSQPSQSDEYRGKLTDTIQVSYSVGLNRKIIIFILIWAPLHLQ